MSLDRTSCYRALTARDSRFDGTFFVGVTSTRIYCRPVCRSKTPRETNCRFFSNAAAAERSGFRPCLRCRPELAPGNAPVDATSVLAEQASRAIADGALNGGSVDELAKSLGVTGRHVRRAITAHLGVSPIDLATTHRLLLAKRLLHESRLPVGQVAFAAGFESLRRFNDAFRARYRLTPAALRREATAASEGASAPTDHLELTLEYRPPLHWTALLGFLAARATPGAEVVADGRYSATVRVTAPSSVRDAIHPGRPRGTAAKDDIIGEVSVGLRDGPATRPRIRGDGAVSSRASTTPAVAVRISPSLVPVLMPLLARLRDLLDLDANPEVIARQLVRAGVAESAAAFAGVRVPGALDGFALALRAIIGQQVSVKGATTVMGRLVERFGEPYTGLHPSLTRLMPAAAAIARLRTGDIASLGMPGARADAVLALARAVADGSLVLTAGADPDRTIRALTALPGVGEWTAHYIAMRALRWPDAFPANDLILRRAAGNLTAAQLAKRAEAWRPWRAYAAMHLWRSFSSTSTTS